MVVVAEKRAAGLVQACADAGAFPIIEARWADAAAAIAKIKPAAVILAETDPPNVHVAEVLAQQIAAAQPIIPVIARVRDDGEPAIAGALPVSRRRAGRAADRAGVVRDPVAHAARHRAAPGGDAANPNATSSPSCRTKTRSRTPPCWWSAAAASIRR